MGEGWPVSEALGLRRLLDQAGGSSYRILVRNLVLACSIGIYEHEKRDKQRVRIGVELDVADPGSFAGGELRRVLNYETVIDGIKRILAQGHVDLVETLAERIAAMCLEDPRAVRATVSVEKLDIYPESDGVGVSIVRRRAARDGGQAP
jgi:7,8-dihydroneopterin aldolase/epimerase/oxygenase